LSRSPSRGGQGATGLLCETLTYTPDLWQRVEPVWKELEDRTGEPSVFLSRPWMGAWTEVFGASVRPEALLWRTASGEVVGCALVSVREQHVGPFAVRRAFLNATGENAVASEHNDLLALPAHRPEIVAALVERLLGLGVEELSLVRFKESGGEEIVARWPTPVLSLDWSEDPFVDLEALRCEGAPYLSALSSNTRAQIRRSMRLYVEEHGPLSIEAAPNVDVALAWLAELEKLHKERWGAQGLPGAFASEDVRRFHRLVIRGAWADPSALSTDLLKVRSGTTIIGLLYNLRRRGSVCFYQSGLAYSADNRLKPGLVAHALAAQHYLDAGEREYDFLAGEPEATQYKRSLSTRSRRMLWSDLPAPTGRMRLIAGLRSLKRMSIDAWRRVRAGEPPFDP